jgi:serine O-acetyltransferase
VLSPERVWRVSAALHRRGLRRPALFVKRLNFFLYHNSLPPDVDFSPDIRFGHHGFGTVIHSKVTIGKDVFIWHNVTIAVRAARYEQHRIVIEDGVRIGAGAIIIAAAGRTIRIGRGARIGAGALVVADVPPGATVVSSPSRVVAASPRVVPDELGEAVEPPIEDPASPRAHEHITDPGDGGDGSASSDLG